MNAPGDAARAAQALRDERSGFSFKVRTANQLQIDGQKRELLPDVVVQLPGDPATLGFLGAKQAAAQIANPCVTRQQFLLAAAHLFFCLASPPRVEEKQADQTRLRQQQ